MLRADPTEFYVLPMPARRSALRRAAARIVSVWQAWLNRRRLMPLLEMDDHMLRDIGVTRYDVTSALAMPAGDDPSRQLNRLSHERRRAARLQQAAQLSR